jgi:hypothetical protein
LTTTKLVGRVSVAVAADLETLVALDDARVRVSATSPNGSTSETEVAGTEEFEVEVTGLPVRVGLAKITGDADVMTTIQWVSDNSRVVDVKMVERSVLQDIAENLAAGATSLVEGQGHAFLSFVDSRGQPTQGVNVALGEATIAYDIGVFFSDAAGDQGETADLGRAVILNAPAEELPGEEQTMVITRDGMSTEIDVLMAADSVTLRTIRL